MSDPGQGPAVRGGGGDAWVVAVLATPDPRSFATARVGRVPLDFGGIPGDRHHGQTRRAGGWEGVFPKGAEIRNRRQVSAVSVDECRAVAVALGIGEVRPEWLGANVLLDGLDGLSALPIGTRLVLPSGAVLVCEGHNQPCRAPGQAIQERHPDRAGLAAAFVKAAARRRGILCSVERPGDLVDGDRVTVVATADAQT